MSVNQLNAEYPEHLNPFHGRRNSIRQSFRGLKKAIVKSFTGKDKAKPVIRPKPVPQQASPTFVPVEHRYTESQIVFPRSRFSERVNKTDASRSPNVNRQTVPATLGSNPFDSADDKGKNTTLPPKPAERTKLRRRKKRAPIPPDGENSGGQYLSPSVNGSKWSLVSTESEMSSMCYSESEVEHVDIKGADRQDEILKITQEIARFAQDTNNNSIVDGEPDKEPAKNDDVDGTKIEVRISPADHEECAMENEKSSLDHENNRTSLNDPITPDTFENDIRQPPGEKSLDTLAQLPDEKSLDTRDRDELDVSNPNLESSGEINISKQSNPQPEIEEAMKSTQDLSEGLNKIVIDHAEEINDTLNIENCDSTNSNYTRQTSQDIENDENTVELRPHNRVELQFSESRYSVKGKIDFFEYNCASPTPKIRKNILTKEKLLGSEESV